VLDDPDAAITRSGQRVMTPAYASPEQIRGEPVTTASDVYSMGVVLYELLCGRHPHRDPTRTPAEIEQAIVATAPEKPSHFAVALRRQIEGDLDTICLKALRKEPERRYASAAQLAEDLQRFLGGRPVTARPETVSYRFGKFVRRNRAGVAVAAALLVVVASLTVFYILRLSHERDIARIEARKAEEVSAFLAGLFASADPNQSRGESVTARQVLDEGRRRVRTELARQPAVLADMLRTIGEAYKNLGLYDEARSAFGEALDIRRKLHREPHPDLVLAMSDLAAIDTETGEYAASAMRAREAVALARTLDDRVALATSLGILAAAVNMEGGYDEAEALFHESINAWNEAEGAHSPRGSIMMNNLALLLHERSRYSEAEPIFKQALELQEEVFGKRHPETATTRYNYAQLLADEGHLEDAKVMWDEVLATDRALYPTGHPNIAFTLSAYGRLLLRLGEYAEAERLQREALAIRRSYHGESHPDVAYSLGALGIAVYERGRYHEAEALLRESLAMHRKLHPNHPIAGNVMNDIGLVLYERGDYVAAEKMHREALEFQRAVAENDERNAMGVSMVRRANDLAALGRLEQADTLASSGYAFVRRVHDDRGMWVVAAMIDLAAIRFQRGFVAEAESSFARGLERMREFESGAPARPRDTRALLGLGRCRLASGDAKAAEQRFREALEIERRYFGNGHPRVARAETALASALLARGDGPEARRLLQSAARVFSAQVEAAQVDRRIAENLLAQSP
jgi:serine/threonine-protein kinase